MADRGFLLMLKAGLECYKKNQSGYKFIDRYSDLSLILLWLIGRFSHKCWEIVDLAWPELIIFVDNV